ncbi:hypothetical protein LEP1GSC170_4296 [Leptospira interrogans serovar Bataviae str. HAI135]|nr:hypothetical protein LEP1GSC170_4296 [Leptospira interrogans serovar Bataviae str. HAI135]
MVFLDKFQYNVFEMVFSGLDKITTLSGGNIDLNSFSSLMDSRSKLNSNSF